MTELYQELVSKLEKLFGKFDLEQKRFVDASNSKISRELGYSDAQFSRLINESATEGEYQRALKNVDRILKVIKLEKQLAKSQSPTKNQPDKWAYITTIIFLLFISLILLFRPDTSFELENLTSDVARDHTLKWTFESSFINPYVKLDDLPSDCNYPCYKYQGKWRLAKSYKLPFFRERNGYHYLATDVDMYARCMVESSGKGDMVEGYEYQKHEIWYDKREWAMDSFMTEEMMRNSYYQNLDFAKTDDFIKLANVHTFFRSAFQLEDTLIKRTGMVIGRDLEMMSHDDLMDQLSEESKVVEIEKALSKIVSKRLEDFSVPIACEDSPLIKANVSEIKDGDTMSFNCQLTTSRKSIDYTKTYILADQYIKNDCVSNN